MNEPSLLAQGTTWFTNNVLIVTRFADWNNPAKTGILTLLICVLGYFFWLKSRDIRNMWGRAGLLFLTVIAGVNAATIFLISLTVWGPL